MRSIRAKRTASGALVFGRGVLAEQFIDRPGGLRKTVILASGVSDSSEERFLAYLRESMLLTRALRLGRPVIYFGSLNAKPLGKSKYYRHKYRNEIRITKSSKKNLVVALPQIFGLGGNSHTLVNSFFEKLIKNERPVLKEGVFRLLIPAKFIPEFLRTLRRSASFSRVSLLHRAPLTPVQLFSILQAAYQGEESFIVRSVQITSEISLIRRERAKGRCPYQLQALNFVRLERELKVYVNERQLKLGGSGSGL